MQITDEFKTLIYWDDDKIGELLTCDSIEYLGGLWLVSAWLESTDDKERYPERIIRFDLARYQDEPFGVHRCVLNDPVPKELLSGPSRSLPPFEVVVAPDIRVSTVVN